MDDKYNKSYLEIRGKNKFEITIVDEDESHARIFIRINNVIISDHSYQKKSFNLDNIYFREVGRVHLGYYDNYIVE